jgi:hypothetical protein
MYFIHPGEHEVAIGSLTDVSLFTIRFFNLDSNSVPSSTIVRSAVKSVSSTESKPRAFNAATSFPVTLVPGGNPNSSPRPILTAGAV